MPDHMTLEQALGLLDRICAGPILGFDRREVRAMQTAIQKALAEGAEFRWMYERLSK